MRTQARTTPFMPGESPPEVMIAIFFLGAIFALESAAGKCDAEIDRRPRKDRPAKAARRIEEKRRWKGPKRMLKGRSKKLPRGMDIPLGLIKKGKWND